LGVGCSRVLLNLTVLGGWRNAIIVFILKRILQKLSITCCHTDSPPRILPGRTKGPERQMAGDTRGRAQIRVSQSKRSDGWYTWNMKARQARDWRLELITATAAMRTLVCQAEAVTKARGFGPRCSFDRYTQAVQYMCIYLIIYTACCSLLRSSLRTDSWW
jgi:hypothetical protein